MIDPNIESLLSLTEVAKLIPVRRGGRRCHVSTIYRWCQVGIKGVRLEHLQCGGTKVSSREAVSRFFRKLTTGDLADVPEVRSVAQRERAAQKAMKALEEAGV